MEIGVNIFPSVARQPVRLPHRRRHEDRRLRRDPEERLSIGARCKISSHTFICEGVTIEDEVFVGHGVMFINDRYPRATNAGGSCRPKPTGGRADARQARRSIGSHATILCGVTIGEGALVGAGAVVTRDVPRSRHRRRRAGARAAPRGRRQRETA